MIGRLNTSFMLLNTFSFYLLMFEILRDIELAVIHHEFWWIVASFEVYGQLNCVTGYYLQTSLNSWKTCFSFLNCRKLLKSFMKAHSGLIFNFYLLNFLHFLCWCLVAAFMKWHKSMKYVIHLVLLFFPLWIGTALVKYH